MQVLEEYKPLYFGDYMIADLFGGRAGGRSYSYSQHALYELLYSKDVVGFFLREVHSTIYSSMWSDLKNRIKEYEEFHGVDLSDTLEWTDASKGENRIVNKENGNSFTTKGFKVSSGNQKASLKSLSEATHLYIEESDEANKEDYNQVKLSLRRKDANIKIIRAFNPPDKDHWIWDDYKLTALSNEEIVNILADLRGESDTDVLERLKSNSKTYYKATPKYDNHISIQTNHRNNIANLNAMAIGEYDKLYDNDLDYYLVHIAGLIPNVGGEVVYYRYDEDLHHTTRTIQDKDVLHVGMDFNITNMSAVIHVVDDGISKAVAEETHIFDTEQMCALLKEKYQGHRVVVYPDATGASRKTSSGKSDHDIIREYGLILNSDTTNPAVRNRINTVNSKFHSGEYLVNRHTCPEYSLALRRLKYKGGMPDKASGYDHITDAGGYFITKDHSSKKDRKLMF